MGIKKLYVFCDGPKSGVMDEPMLETRKLVRAIDWCEVQITEHPINQGTLENVIYGMDKMLSENEAAISLEDDCIPRSDFFQYMSQCLEFYRDDPRVYQVNGYQLPIPLNQPKTTDVYFSRIPMSWGFGVWRRSWRYFRKDVSDARSFFASPQSDEICRLLPHFKGSMEKVIEGKVKSFVYRWCYVINQRDGYCISPYESLIRNIGCDGTGFNYNSDRVTIYDVELREEKHLLFSPSQPVRLASQILRDKFMDQKTPYFYGKLTVRQQLKEWIKKVPGVQVMRRIAAR
jgi:hypothetical protein